MSAGPWKPVRLEIYESWIGELHFQVTVSENLTSASVDYTISIESATPDATIRVALYKPQGKKTVRDKTSLVYSETVPVENANFRGSFAVEKPKLWYPVHYGSQPLYTVVVDLYNGDSILDTKEQKIAFRRARVVQNPLKDAKGTSFYFEINN